MQTYLRLDTRCTRRCPQFKSQLPVAWVPDSPECFLADKLLFDSAICYFEHCACSATLRVVCWEGRYRECLWMTLQFAVRCGSVESYILWGKKLGTS
jgi:hypothetical protein